MTDSVCDSILANPHSGRQCFIKNLISYSKSEGRPSHPDAARSQELFYPHDHNLVSHNWISYLSIQQHILGQSQPSANLSHQQQHVSHLIIRPDFVHRLSPSRVSSPWPFHLYDWIAINWLHMRWQEIKFIQRPVLLLTTEWWSVTSAVSKFHQRKYFVLPNSTRKWKERHLLRTFLHFGNCLNFYCQLSCTHRMHLTLPPHPSVVSPSQFRAQRVAFYSLSQG